MHGESVSRRHNRLSRLPIAVPLPRLPGRLEEGRGSIKRAVPVASPARGFSALHACCARDLRAHVSMRGKAMAERWRKLLEPRLTIKEQITLWRGSLVAACLLMAAEWLVAHSSWLGGKGRSQKRPANATIAARCKPWCVLSNRQMTADDNEALACVREG